MEPAILWHLYPLGDSPGLAPLYLTQENVGTQTKQSLKSYWSHQASICLRLPQHAPVLQPPVLSLAFLQVSPNL